MSIYLFYTQSIIIIILAGVLWALMVKIGRLENELAEEKEKRIRPLLTLIKNRETSRMQLKNSSYMHVKNIVIDPATLTVKYDFPKDLTIKFDTISFLKPDETVNLEYRVFDKEFNITDERTCNVLFLHISDGFKLSLSFADIDENIYSSTIECLDGNFVTRFPN